MTRKVIDDQVPPHLRARRSRVTRYIARVMLSASGWKVSGSIPNEERLIIVAAPHTSNWDWVLAMLTILALNANIRWIGKSSIFKTGFAWFFQWLGGIPVDRDNPSSLIERVKDIVSKEKGLMIGVAPEGSRQKVDRWKTGFLRIAEITQSKILLFSIDSPTKNIQIGKIFNPIGNNDDNLRLIKDYYRNFKGINPSQF
jgi:1-acyl-sn-glycerol-3-phosphate acyltransferase